MVTKLYEQLQVDGIFARVRGVRSRRLMLFRIQGSNIGLVGALPACAPEE